jgi:hypothetical protein
LPALLRGELDPKASVVYTAYLLVSRNRLHHLYGSYDEVFQAPYADRVDKFFDGSTPGQEMFMGLPDTIGQLLTQRGFELLRHPTGPFARALRVDGAVCTDWTPRAPIQLYKISADEQATTANTGHCAAALRSHGVNVPVVDVGDQTYHGSRHLDSNLSGTAQVTRWFTALP